MLRNKYYGPEKESSIANRNALTQGQNIQNQYMPDQLRLANALAQLKNQYYGPNMQSTISNRNALTQGQNIQNQFMPDKLRFENQAAQTQNEYLPEKLRLANELASKQNELYNDKTRADINYKNTGGANRRMSPEAVLAKDYADVQAGFVPGTNGTQQFKSQEDQNKALEIMDRKGNEAGWKSMPANAKMNVLAYANGAGIGIDEATRELAKGTSLDKLYEKHGFDPKNPPEPDFLSTQGNITKLKDRQAALKEMQVISKFVKEGLGPYSKTYGQYSPAQIADALKGKNDDQQAKFLAARGLVPELTGLRLMAANAKATVHAIKSMQEKSMMNIKIFESLVKPEVWQKAQDLMDHVLDKGMKKSVQSYSHHNLLKEKNPQEAQSSEQITDDDIDTTARETGMTREQVIQRLMSEGRYNG
jgi:NACalpha-BTF3-like transcription factor